MRRTLFLLLVSTLGTMLGIGLIGMLLVGAFSEPPPDAIPAGAWLVFDETLAFNEQGELPDALSLLEGIEPALPLRKVIAAVDAASSDPRIVGIALYETPWHTGMVGLAELRAALQRFRDGGKPVLAWASQYEEAGWYLASVADHVSLAPLGVLEVDGFAAEVMYFTDALAKLGVEVQVTRVGRYKSAVEPFVERSMSEPDREQMRALLDEYHETFLTATAESRGFETDTLRAIATEEGVLTAERAEELDLVDAVAPFDVFLDSLVDRGGWDEEQGIVAQVGVRRWLRELPADPGVPGPVHVVVVYAEGTIVDGESEDEIGGATLARSLRILRDDDDVDAVVLRIDSPGGSAAASEAILREMRLLRDVKPVVVSMGAVAASGGYWIACYADRIYAHSHTVTGSIGVFGMFPNVAGTLEKVGIAVETVKITPTADLFSPLRRKEDAELQRVQVWIDDIYEDFLDRVAEGRGLERESVAELAQGRVWSGRDARDAGLIDAFGGLQDAVAAAAELVGDGSVTVEYLEPEAEPIESMLLEALGFEDAPLVGVGAFAEIAALLPPSWRGLAGEVRTLLAAGRRGSVQARLPFTLRLR